MHNKHRHTRAHTHTHTHMEKHINPPVHWRRRRRNRSSPSSLRTTSPGIEGNVSHTRMHTHANPLSSHPKHKYTQASPLPLHTCAYTHAPSTHPRRINVVQMYLDHQPFILAHVTHAETHNQRSATTRTRTYNHARAHTHTHTNTHARAHTYPWHIGVVEMRLDHQPLHLFVLREGQLYTHAHTYTHARTHTNTHARTHARTSQPLTTPQLHIDTTTQPFSFTPSVLCVWHRTHYARLDQPHNHTHTCTHTHTHTHTHAHIGHAVLVQAIVLCWCSKVFTSVRVSVCVCVCVCVCARVCVFGRRSWCVLCHLWDSEGGGVCVYYVPESGSGVRACMRACVFVHACVSLTHTFGIP